jgi:transcriptional regulator with XRE-family HTH domain
MKTIYSVILSHVRDITGLSYRRLAERMDCSHTYLAQVEQGNKRLDDAKLNNLAAICGYTGISELTFMSLL